KRKGLALVIAGIIIFLVGSFIFSTSSNKEQINEETANQTYKQGVEIGILQTTSHPALDTIQQGVVDGLAKHNYQENEKNSIQIQNGQGDQNLLNTMAQSLVDDQVDVLIGIGTPASQALANASDEIPIIMGAVSDPAGAGLIDSLENPKQNITGVKDQAPIVAQLNLMMELLPTAEKIGVFYSSGEDNSQVEGQRAVKIIKEKELTPATYTVSNTNEIQQMVAKMAQEVDVIYLPTDNTVASAFDTVVQEANRHQLPIIPTVDTMIAQGGLATVGIDQSAIGMETGRMAAEVLDGKDPKQLPVYILTEGEQLINKEQADFLNLTISKELLKKATIIKNNN
ncbi:MAG: ABC transporter substrate-binding protein, partial [Staphylococcus equorum]|nr:ABC transporter substrate-binding protein [Staphylococcus equorum]